MKTNSINTKKKSHMGWAWILMVTFFALGLLDIRFGLLAFACMIAPLFHVLKGRGKIHCQAYCPRASFFDRWIRLISINGDIPNFMKTKLFKKVLLGLMASVFIMAIIRSGGDPGYLAYAMYRLMFISTVVGILMGVVFKPRTWCTVCPMGYGSGLLDKSIRKKAA